MRTVIRTLEPQIGEQNKNIEARKNATVSYKKRVYQVILRLIFLDVGTAKYKF